MYFFPTIVPNCAKSDAKQIIFRAPIAVNFSISALKSASVFLSCSPTYGLSRYLSRIIVPCARPSNAKIVPTIRAKP